MNARRRNKKTIKTLLLLYIPSSEFYSAGACIDFFPEDRGFVFGVGRMRPENTYRYSAGK
jgi:hypothetical protein